MTKHLPRCGRISYTNDLPVYTAIDEAVVTFPGTLVWGVPSKLNHELLAGELDVSPISSAFYAQHANSFLLIPEICIGARREVHSVCCISSIHPQELAGKPVMVTKESATGRALFTLICREWYGFDPQLIDSDEPFDRAMAEGCACLLIGDKAIDASLQAPPASVYDIGELWHRFTGDQMVYAVWAVRDEFAGQEPEDVFRLAVALRTSLDWGLGHSNRVIERAESAHPRMPGFYAQYYRSLNFRFDEPARQGLERFFACAKKAGVLSQAPTLRFIEQVAGHV